MSICRVIEKYDRILRENMKKEAIIVLVNASNKHVHTAPKHTYKHPHKKTHTGMHTYTKSHRRGCYKNIGPDDEV